MSLPARSKQQASRATPHVRLNSGKDNILNDMSNPGPSSRSLTRKRPSLMIRTQQSRREIYRHPHSGGDSSEQLLQPPNSRFRRYRDDDSPVQSPISGNSSRRTSWSTDSMESPIPAYYESPFSDSRSPSRLQDEENNVNTQTVSEKYNILPSSGLLIFPEDIEKDDWLHNPDSNDRDECTICSKRGLANVGGLLFLTLGVLVLFIGYPVLTFVQRMSDAPVKNTCELDPMCISVGSVPLLKNVRHSLVDPDTPKSALTRTSVDGKTQNLVFSDEFNVDGRTFYDGDDAYFQAMDFWYGVTGDLEVRRPQEVPFSEVPWLKYIQWYDPDAVSTSGGALTIQFDLFKNHDLNYRSGMLQSWNKLCFKGGHLEASISLPGRGDTKGFWPGFWTMGNLGRPGFAATTDGMWPYSYDNVCDAGITPNQSDPSGLNYLPGMRLPACTCDGEDHPSPGNSRSSPEIDAIEASVTYLQPPNLAAIGSASQSFQCAPFDVFWSPDYDFIELYDHSLTTMNSYQGGPYQQAISGVTNLNNGWYNGNNYQTYAFEYTPGSKGKLTWYVGKQPTWTLDGRALGPNGNVAQRVIPVEPMSLIMNFGMSDSFSAINSTGIAATLPAKMRIDYVRIYQTAGQEMVTCDPPGYPTTEFIAKHPEPYSNPNLTHWSQTPYNWPRNSLMNGCKASNYKGS